MNYYEEKISESDDQSTKNHKLAYQNSLVLPNISDEAKKEVSSWLKRLCEHYSYQGQYDMAGVLSYVSQKILNK